MYPLVAVLLAVAVSSITCLDDSNKEIHITKEVPLNLGTEGDVTGILQVSQVPGQTPLDPPTKNFAVGMTYNDEKGVAGSLSVNHQPSGNTKLDLNAKAPLYQGTDNKLDVIGHASKTIAGPSDAQSIGGELQYNHISGIQAGVAATSFRGAGTKVDLGVKVPVFQGTNSQLDAIGHGSKTFGGPFDNAQSVGGGFQFKHDNGVFGKVDATHYRDLGNSYSASVGRSFDLGPGTFSVGAGIGKNTWSSGVDKNIGVSYRVPNFFK